jgi:hypothetical protein
MLGLKGRSMNALVGHLCSVRWGEQHDGRPIREHMLVVADGIEFGKGREWLRAQRETRRGIQEVWVRERDCVPMDLTAEEERTWGAK